MTDRIIKAILQAGFEISNKRFNHQRQLAYLDLLQENLLQADIASICRDFKHLKYMRLTLEMMLDKNAEDEISRKIKFQAMKILQLIVNQWAHEPEVIALLDLTHSFDFDQIMQSKTASQELKDHTCLLAIGLIRHNKNTTFETVTSNPTLLLQNLVRILYSTVQSLVTSQSEFIYIKKEIVEVRKQLKRWNGVYRDKNTYDDSAFKLTNESSIQEVMLRHQEEIQRIKLQQEMSTRDTWRTLQEMKQQIQLTISPRPRQIVTDELSEAKTFKKRSGSMLNPDNQRKPNENLMQNKTIQIQLEFNAWREQMELDINKIVLRLSSLESALYQQQQFHQKSKSPIITPSQKFASSLLPKIQQDI